MNKPLSNHFEVLAQRGGDWTILGIYDDESEAIREAKANRLSGGYRAVKVVRERFDVESGTYISRTVFSEGAPRKKSKFDDDDPILAACQKPADFYSLDGRRTIGRLLQDELTRWGITPVELVHHPDNFRRLDNDGNALERAVQRAAIAQVQDTGQNVRERAKQIHQLIATAAAELRADWSEGRVPKLVPAELAALVDRLEGDTDRVYLLNCALAGYLGDAESMRDKCARVLTLVDDPQRPWVVEVADGLIGELLSGVSVIKDFLGEQESRGGALEQLADMSRGCFESDNPGIADDVRILNRLINDGLLPHAKNAVKLRFINELSGPRRLVEGSLVEELSALGRVIDRLKHEDGSLIGGYELRDVLKSRCSRYLTAESIGECLSGVDTPVGRIQILLSIESHIVGGDNKRRLASYLLPILDSPDNEDYFVVQNGTVVQRLQRLASLQRRVLDSRFQETDKRKIAERLDDFCVSVLKNNDFFKRLEQQETSTVDKGMKLLRLCAGGYFTEGRAADAARQRLIAYVRPDGFLEAFLADAEDEAARAARLLEFHKLLTDAGLSKGSAS